jgi:hypothetical protein
MNHHAIHPSDRYLFTIVLGSISDYSADWNSFGKCRAFTVITVGDPLGEAHREGENNSNFIALHSRYCTVAKTRVPLLN